MRVIVKGSWGSRTSQLLESNSAGPGFEGKSKPNNIPRLNFLPHFLHLKEPLPRHLGFQFLGEIAPSPPGLGQV